MLKIKSFERVHRHLCVLHSRHSTTEPATKQTARTKTYNNSTTIAINLITNFEVGSFNEMTLDEDIF